jgi:hypothetical protein
MNNGKPGKENNSEEERKERQRGVMMEHEDIGDCGGTTEFGKQKINKRWVIIRKKTEKGKYKKRICIRRQRISDTRGRKALEIEKRTGSIEKIW